MPIGRSQEVTGCEISMSFKSNLFNLRLWKKKIKKGLITVKPILSLFFLCCIIQNLIASRFKKKKNSDTDLRNEMANLFFCQYMSL